MVNYTQKKSTRRCTLFLLQQGALFSKNDYLCTVQVIIYSTMGKIFSLFALFCLVSCSNPVEKICAIYEQGTEEVASANTLDELNSVRQQTSDAISDVVASNRVEIKEILQGDNGAMLLQGLKSAETTYVTALKNRVSAVYPPARQLCDVYSNAMAKANVATTYEEVAKIAQSVVGDVNKIVAEYKNAVEAMSSADRQMVDAAKESYNSVITKKMQELS